MTKNSKRKLLLITVLLAMLLISSAYSSLIPKVHAAATTPQQKGIAVLTDVVGLDMSKYSTATTENPPDTYLGVVPQENVRYTLESNSSNLDIGFTFANGKLRKIHVLESKGSPRLTKTAANTLEMAKGFLSSYQGYSGDSFYGELGSMLNSVDVGKNLTKTSGNTKLEVTNSEGYETFKWTYMFNNVEATDKCVALGYKNGLLKYFLDNWNLYKIGSTSVNLTEEEAIKKGMESANAFSWKMGSDNNTYRVKNFHVANAMVWETVFLSNLYADTPRSQDPLMLYPMRHVWVSLDKFYPGNVYGINVYLWADTGEVAYIHERASTMDPPADLVATLDDFTVEAVKDQMSVAATQFDVLSIPQLAPPAFTVVMLGTVPVWLARKKNLSKKGFKIWGMLLCVLISSAMLLGQVSTVNASSQKECIEIWGSESSGAYGVPPNNATWRKTSGEIDDQQQVSYLISVYFSGYYHGYDAYNNQGSNSLKSMILDDISYAEANYPRVAVVDFDHGQGRHDYPEAPSGEFHFMFEDNIGTAIGNRDNIIWVAANGVYDMDIYPRTALGKVVFAFINTCGSANLTNLENGQPWQGLLPGTYRARGMPFAWANRIVDSGMSSHGYSAPDSGDFCYIGFPFGSAALDQTLGGYGPEYWIWVRDFFWYASSPDNSVNNALDDASLDNYGNLFGNTCLANDFWANWPRWDGVGWVDRWFPHSRMVVYGNGNIHLYRKGGIWHFDGNALDSSHNNDGIVCGATWTTGKFGSALSFDGYDDYVWVPHNSALNPTQITVEAWIKPSTVNWQIRQIAAKGGVFVLRQYGNQLHWYCWDGGDYEPHVYWSGLEVGKWYYVVGVSDGTNQRLYVNGELKAEMTHAYSPGGTEGMGIGSYWGEPFSGVIDEFCIYGYVLSAGQIADNAAVASYHLNGGNSAYDSSPYGNTGTVYGASWATGLRTSSGHSLALSFDGVNDYMSVASVSGLSGNTPHSIEAWVKVNSLPPNRAWILQLGNEGTGSHHWLINNQGGTQFGAWNGGQTQPTLPVGQWTHIAMTFDGTTLKSYVNGALSQSVAATFNLAGTPLTLAQAHIGENYFNGIIDDVRIYNRELSQSEISNYYAANLPRHWLTICALGWIKIDGQYTTYIVDVARGTHTVEVQGSIQDPYLGWLYFDYFTYDSTTNYNNPMTMSVSKDTEVIAHYYWSGW